jgi:hypothetical protein
MKSLKDSKQQELNRIKKPNGNDDIIKSIERQIEFLTDEIQTIKDKIKDIISNNKELKLIYNIAYPKYIEYCFLYFKKYFFDKIIENKNTKINYRYSMYFRYAIL